MTHNKMFLMKPVNCVIWIRLLRPKEAALLLKPPISSGWLKRSRQVLEKGAILSGKRALGY